MGSNPILLKTKSKLKFDLNSIVAVYKRVNYTLCIQQKTTSLLILHVPV